MLIVPDTSPPPSSNTATSSPFPDGFDSLHDVLPDLNASKDCGLEAPPANITPHEAVSFEVDDSGDVVSHDLQLNTDGEALYRFLLSQSTRPPIYRLHCRGTHTETRLRCSPCPRCQEYHRNDHNHTSHATDNKTAHGIHRETEMKTEDVVDFDFYIDLTSYIDPSPALYSIPDSDSAYRGGMTPQTGSPTDNLQDVSWRDMKAAEKRKRDREERGLPPWITNNECESYSVPRVSHAMGCSKKARQWIDDYCQSTKALKEFEYEKVVYGWDALGLTNAIRQHIIHSGRYNGTISISFQTTANKISIRPHQWLNLSFMLTLIYPVLWLYMRFSSPGGGRWNTCGAAYSLKRYLPVDERDEALVQGIPHPSADATGRGRTVETPAGLKKLVGTREGEWFREWEDTIADLVGRRYRSSVPIPSAGIHAGSSPVATLLDGY